VTDGLRLAVSLLTVLPVRRVPAPDRTTARTAMLWAPAVGLLLGLLAAVAMEVARLAGLDPLVAAALGLALLAALTRGLHLDGLADTADGLGARRPGPAALAIMRSGDIGPFGVVTLVLTLLLQAAAAAQAGPLALLAAVTVGRVALVLACRRGVPAARPDGLGALVAATVGPGQVAAWVALAGVASVGLGWRGPVAVAIALASVALLLRHCTRRLGGVTGDVLGAAAEVAATAVLLVLATGS
jgi:adenosylcobinamide-GDP ribazoletransferase